VIGVIPVRFAGGPQSKGASQPSISEAHPPRELSRGGKYSKSANEARTALARQVVGAASFLWPPPALTEVTVIASPFKVPMTWTYFPPIPWNLSWASRL